MVLDLVFCLSLSTLVDVAVSNVVAQWKKNDVTSTSLLPLTMLVIVYKNRCIYWVLNNYNKIETSFPEFGETEKVQWFYPYFLELLPEASAAILRPPQLIVRSVQYAVEVSQM